MEPDQPTILIYCDGAASPNPGTGAWAAILSFQEGNPSAYRELVGAVPNTTNNRMELTAALEGLRALKKPCKVIVRSDSQYLCNAFNKKWIPNWIKKGWKTSQNAPVLNQDLWEFLIEQSKKHQITWEWVKGHSDDEFNNRCDELAVAARKKWDEDHAT